MRGCLLLLLLLLLLYYSLSIGTRGPERSSHLLSSSGREDRERGLGPTLPTPSRVRAPSSLSLTLKESWGTLTCLPAEPPPPPVPGWGARGCMWGRPARGAFTKGFLKEDPDSCQGLSRELPPNRPAPALLLAPGWQGPCRIPHCTLRLAPTPGGPCGTRE